MARVTPGTKYDFTQSLRAGQSWVPCVAPGTLALGSAASVVSGHTRGKVVVSVP